MRARWTVFIAALVGATAGCAATDAGPVAGYDGAWTISKRGVVTPQAGALTRSAVEEATQHCTGRGQRFRQIEVKEIPAGLLSTHAESQLKFACD